ncbi:hypothetical protein AAG906_006795 [Vitis piasezkii]
MENSRKEVLDEVKPRAKPYKFSNQKRGRLEFIPVKRCLYELLRPFKRKDTCCPPTKMTTFFVFA